MRALLAMLLAGWAISASGAETGRLAALVTDGAVDEISGFAASHQHPNILWTHNDSGNPARIFAIDTKGKLRATIRLSNARNFDWEDIAGFRDGDAHWLMIADTGDNGGIRKSAQLIFLPEPAHLLDAELPAARIIDFVWPDGPRDCEAVAVDMRDRAIYLVTKKRVPPELYRIPLDADSSAAPVVAERVGVVRHVRQPSANDLSRNPVYGRYRAQITSLDISADGSQLALLNYLQARVYRRNPGESWGEAVQRKPKAITYPWMTQAEAIAFDPDGRSLWIGTEVLPAPLLQIVLDEP